MLLSAGSARCLSRNDIGTIAAGKQADLAMLKLDELWCSGAGDPLAALILCGADGRVIDVEIVGLDVGVLIARHRDAARAHIN